MAKRRTRNKAFLNVRIDDELRAQLTELAAQNDRTLAAQIRVLIREALEQRAAVAS